MKYLASYNVSGKIWAADPLSGQCFIEGSYCEKITHLFEALTEEDAKKIADAHKQVVQEEQPHKQVYTASVTLDSLLEIAKEIKL